ncbi:hypothetical protein [Burkholderia gladioli]|uniref:hypothetical protein n=1 Tax=Burkholderia gladioli TaxID=28095 RepID=UPI00163FCB86|nr:hypothetical protein [Burkholderia gladioli]
MSDKLSDDERARLDAEVKRDYEISAKWPFDASDAWWNDDSRYVAPPAVDSAHAAARAIIRDLSDRGGIKRGFENIDEETRVEIVAKLAAIIRAASPAPAIPAVDPVAIHDAALEAAATAVEAHDRDGREWINGSLWDTLTREACARIRTLKAAPAISESEWQPIETAPKDGSPVLLIATRHSMLYPHPEVIVGYWRSGWWSGPSTLSHVANWMPAPSIDAARKGEKS